MTHREMTWKTRDGLDIFGEVWEPEVISPKAVVCLVHGLGEHSSRYAHVAQALGRDGFVLYAADVRGHGRSGGPRGHAPSVTALMDDVDLLLEHAKADFPGLPLFLYGHSNGATFVLYHALTRHPQVKGVIATSAGLHSALEEQKIKLALVKVLGGLVPRIAIPTGLDPKTISRDEKVVQTYTNDPLVHDKGTLGFAKIMMFEVHPWILAHAGEFQLPLLLMHGKKDALTFPSSSIEVADALDENQCTLVLWENGYHELHNEPEKEEVFKTLTLWMNARLNEGQG